MPTVTESVSADMPKQTSEIPKTATSPSFFFLSPVTAAKIVKPVARKGNL